MKRISAAIAALLCLCLLFAGCTKASYPHDAPEPAYEGRADSAADFNHGLPEEAQTSSSEGDLPDVLSSRKIIRNADLDVQTLDFDDFMNKMLSNVRELGGYVEANSMNQSGTYGGKPLRTASVTVRIPAEKLDGFLSGVDGLGNVTRRVEGLDDVTDKYVDTEARIASLRTEYDTLLGLLAQADSLNTIFTIQERLTEVRYQIESYESRLRSYDSLSAFSKVSMHVTEVLRETPVEEETFGQEVSRRFRESLEDVGDGFTDFAKWFIGDLPHIVCVLVFLAIPVVIVLIATRKQRRRRRAARKAAKNEVSAGAENGPASEG